MLAGFGGFFQRNLLKLFDLKWSFFGLITSRNQFLMSKLPQDCPGDIVMTSTKGRIGANLFFSKVSSFLAILLQLAQKYSGRQFGPLWGGSDKMIKSQTKCKEKSKKHFC